MRTILALFGSVYVLAISAFAQSSSIDWFTIDGGGGTTTGGVFSVGGTIRQPDAGTLNGGSYSSVGEFWGILFRSAVAGGAVAFHQVHRW